MKKIYFCFCIAIDLIGLAFFAGSVIFGAVDGETFGLALPCIAVSVMFLLISYSCLRKSINNAEGRLVINSILMKFSIALICFAFLYIWLKIPAAFISFLALGIFMSVVTVFVCKSKPIRPYKYETKATNFAYSFKFKGKWEYDGAVDEIKRVANISEPEAFEEYCNANNLDNNKIYDYAATPFSYMFYWLCDAGLLKQEFFDEVQDDDFIVKMLRHEITPVDVLRELDYYFGSEYMMDEVIPFFRSYYDTDNRFGDNDNYIYDYFDCQGAYCDRYYYVDFSWNVLNKLTAKIRERYQEWQAENTAHPGKEYYDEPQLISKDVYSSRFAASLDAYKAGAKNHGFPNNDEAAYLARCIDSLDTMPEEEIRKVERYFRMIYGVTDTPYKVSIDNVKPNAIHIVEPAEEGDVVYVVSGDAEFEPEHGISFTVRNGLVIDMGYSYDFDDPYSKENIEKYKRCLTLKGIDFTKLKTEADLRPYVESGILVKTKLLPDIPYCMSRTGEEYVYLTPDAINKKEIAEKHIRDVRIYSGMNDLEALYIPNYYMPEASQSSEQESHPIVPRALYIRNADMDKWVNMFFKVDVWN